MNVDFIVMSPSLAEYKGRLTGLAVANELRYLRKIDMQPLAAPYEAALEQELLPHQEFVILVLLLSL